MVYSISIGDMIEFLGEDIKSIFPEYVEKIDNWNVMLHDEYFCEEELCDVLWEAVKYKLK